MAPKTVEGGQIWLKCITGDLIMMIRDKNNIFERVENFHADLAWNYPVVLFLEKPAPRYAFFVICNFRGSLVSSAKPRLLTFSMFTDIEDLAEVVKRIFTRWL